jgi:small subunit ribosomal protein S17
MTEKTNNQRGDLTGIKAGVVIADTRDKTRTVSVNYQLKHPIYGKYLKRQTRIHVHDEENASKKGDLVEIVACRPISKSKNWRLVRIVKASAGPELAHVESAEIEPQTSNEASED